MRKANKKQIVAMTLALSMLTSSVGVCGAAAADAVPDGEGSGLEVTLVPLGESEGASSAEKASAQPDEQPVAPEASAEAAASKGSEETPESGEETPGEDTSADKPGVERPKQSDTVETLPGTAEDNKNHIAGKDDAESPDTPETPDKSGTGEDTDDTDKKEDAETPNEGGKDGSKGDAETTPAQADKPAGDDAGEKEPEAEEKDDLDYSCAYDPDTGRFKVTFNIAEDAEGDQTVELSKVQEVVNAYGKQMLDEYLSSEDGKSDRDRLSSGSAFRHEFKELGLTYIYHPDGTVSLVEEPGCTTVFDVSLSNGSRHTYVYKNNSFTVATPDMKNDDKSGVIGFDGQELPEDYTKGYLSPKYNLTDPDANGVIETIIDDILKTSESRRQYYVDKDGNLTTTWTKPRIEKGTPVKEIDGKYYVYSEAADCYYGGFTDTQVVEDPNNPGHYVVKSTTSSKVSEAIKEDGSKYYAPWVRGGSLDATRPKASDVQTALNKYFSQNHTTLEDEILKYYNNADGTNYTSIEELLANNPNAEKELTSGEGATTALNPLIIRSSSQYDDFYKNILSFNVGSKDDMDAFLSGDSVDHGHGHGSWASDGNQMTIGDYMADKLNETEGAWDKANAYFNSLLASGMSAEAATWAAFTMAVNIDGPRADNNYQNTAWSWYASMVLHQADGTFELTKTDADTGKVIGDDEGEGQTSFYLWTYDDETGKPMYCTYVEPTYTTNSDGEQVLKNDGFYCWVEYDPAKDKMTYTITTTNGSLKIDYLLLENVVYYLQEAIAPEGYDADPNIYVICDKDAYDQLVESGAFDNVENPAAGSSAPVAGWLGAITGGESLKINFLNTASVPDPDPDPVPVDPKDPDSPVPPENPEQPPVQDAHADSDTPVLPQNPENPAVQDAHADTLPQTGTTGWLAGVLMSFGTALMACGWFFTRRQHAPRH